MEQFDVGSAQALQALLRRKASGKASKGNTIITAFAIFSYSDHEPSLLRFIRGISSCVWSSMPACVYQAIQTKLRENSDVFTGFEQHLAKYLASKRSSSFLRRLFACAEHCCTRVKTHKLLQVCKQVVTRLFTSCQQVMFALVVPCLLKQVWNKLLKCL